MADIWNVSQWFDHEVPGVGKFYYKTPDENNFFVLKSEDKQSVLIGKLRYI